MKDQRVVVNPFRILSPKLDSEASRFEDLHQMPVSEHISPEEGLLIMMSKLIEISKILSRAVVNADAEQLAICERLAEEIHTQEGMVTKNLVASSAIIGHNLFQIVVRFPGRMERMGDMLQNILTCCRIKQRDGIPFSDKALGELSQIFAILLDMLTNVRDSLIVRNRVLMLHILDAKQQLTQLLYDSRFNHWERLEKGYCAPQASSLYLDILDSFTAIAEYLGKMCDSLLSIEEISQE
jgi:Na+/phosphate symporter